MARDTVVKIEILCHSDRREEVISRLEETGSVHLLDISDSEEAPLSPVEPVDDKDLAALNGALAKAIPFLREALHRKKANAETVLTVKELDSVRKDEKLKESVFRAAAVSDELSELKAGEEETRRKAEFLSRWTDLPIEFSALNRDGSFSLRAGSVPQGSDRSLQAFAASEVLFHIEMLSDTRAVAFWHTEIENRVLDTLAEAGFTAEDFSAFSGDPKSELARLEKRLEKVRKRREQLKEEAAHLARNLAGLEALADAVGLTGFRRGASGSGRGSRSAMLLHAWARKADIPELRASLEELGEVDLQEIEADENDNPPVFLSESAGADPYLMLTDMYGRPNGADPDPTPHMAPFYAMFFGICIGDAGYGLALAAGSAIGWYLTKKRQGNTRLFRLLFQGGLASVFWGILLGGWFGAPFDSLPPLLQAAAGPLNSLAPGGEGFSLSNQFLYLTLVFGVIQLAWGVVVNLGKRLREGEGFAAVLDQSGWMLSLLGLFPWLFDHYLFNIYDNTGIIDSVLLGMLGAGALLIFIMGGREASNIGGKFGLGAYACYGIVNLLGDVLSYSRLFALALSSAIIASVINDIAGMLTGSIPVVGILLAVLVLAGGHLFNLAMAVLSGFIHTARLQFVEFFGKFYDGTGVPFTALRYEPKFVRIKR